MSGPILARRLPLSGAGSRRRRNLGPQPAAKLVARHSKSGITVMPWLARRWRGCRVARLANTRVQTLALLRGLIFGSTGAAMSPTTPGRAIGSTATCQDVLKQAPEACPVGRVPAAEIEAAVIDPGRGIFRQPEIIVRDVARGSGGRAGPNCRGRRAGDAHAARTPAVGRALNAEQARIVQLLVGRVDVRAHGAEVRLRPNGIGGLVREVAGSRRAAA